MTWHKGSLYYNGWLLAHSISNVFTFGSDGSILFCILNAPGVYHDAVVANSLYNCLLDLTPDPFYIIADAAFPTNQGLRKKIRKPLASNFDDWPLDADEFNFLAIFNEQLVSARQSAEWGCACFKAPLN
ncbi:hypothetical protein RUND412_010633, partial [Rhizina undulata]